jgi:hypothetical protein
MFAMMFAFALVIVGGAMSTKERPYAHIEKAVNKVINVSSDTDLHLYDCMNGTVVRYQGINMVVVTGDDGEPIKCPAQAREERTIRPKMGPDDSCPTGSYDSDGGCSMPSVEI